MLQLWFKVRDKLDALGHEAGEINQKDRDLFDIRSGERAYAKLNDPTSQEVNRYGQPINIMDITGHDIPKNRSMYINENPRVGDNPNRNKQHGFHFTADNCIGCHACEAACSEKNDNPAHISFRSVGYVEGGTYPDFRRMNISMACNHCDDPVCLKGCPTKAYTKHAEYGAVLQDPDTCFGCGYCTWVCPYNAPQLDPIQGQVSKCNMCVDRLEVGLKPACVSACLGNALDFGVIENVPERREQASTRIPGFPDPEITHPNIRFQQTRGLPDEVARTDSMPIKYQKDETGVFHSVVDEKAGKEKFWGFNRLSSRENPLVIFTLATQAVMGAFFALFLGSWLGIDAIQQLTTSAAFVPVLILLMAIQGGVLVLSTLHLGKPLRFYRGFNNLRYSPLSREALGVALFLTGMAVYTAIAFIGIWLDGWFLELLAGIFGAFALVSGVAGLWFMHRIYRIKARPFWNHWQVITSFFGALGSLGSVLLGAIFLPVLVFGGGDWAILLPLLAFMMLSRQCADCLEPAFLPGGAGPAGRSGTVLCAGDSHHHAGGVFLEK
jgi:DMSO reductase iron-sulfur subunit